ncbi:MAG: hypothetical protein I8H98_12405 [Moraxellaceae bacterium]|nr:hypothetical protein [Moraxellaceae bacterium]MBH2029256.1 hypothetical protein [Moraxellaceae bacterium]
MKKHIILTTLLFSLCGEIYANDRNTAADSTEIHKTTPICLISGTPTNNQYTEIKRLKIGKNTYGSVTDLYPRIIDKAEKLDADAIIHYNASQRFGFWPWRLVRPVMTGTAIKWLSTPPSCQSLGGIEIK